ncbi:hypothetical protein [Microbacterium sp. XT11]|uniref:hypothetical protein n=1 Tax=Microbacterium sp. XT11 TaxID=367477 RepID=UPI0008356005|nr:hypothetical protein [Microbacterium sp. XT11]
MAWSTRIFDTQTGAPIEIITPRSGTWSRGDRMPNRTVLNLGDDGLTRAQRKDLFQPRVRSVAVCWDDTPVYFGRITNVDYEKNTQELTLTHQDFRTLAAKRHLWGVSSYNPAFTMDFRGYSMRGVVRQILYYAFVHPYSPAWPINVDVGGAELGSSPWALYFGYDLQTADEILQDIEDDLNGPDIELEPVYRSGVAWLEARIGTPFLTGPTFELPLTASATPGVDDGGSLLNVKVQADGTEQATGVFTLGRGSEEDMRWGEASLPSSYPVSSDYVVPYKDVDDTARLNTLAQSWVQSHAGPRVQWSADVLTRDVSPAQLRVGSMLRILTDGDPWIDDGVISRRVIGYKGTTESDQFTLILEEG